MGHFCWQPDNVTSKRDGDIPWRLLGYTKGSAKFTLYEQIVHRFPSFFKFIQKWMRGTIRGKKQELPLELYLDCSRFYGALDQMDKFIILEIFPFQINVVRCFPKSSRDTAQFERGLSFPWKSKENIQSPWEGPLKVRPSLCSSMDFLEVRQF